MAKGIPSALEWVKGSPKREQAMKWLVKQMKTEAEAKAWVESYLRPRYTNSTVTVLIGDFSTKSWQKRSCVFQTFTKFFILMTSQLQSFHEFPRTSCQIGYSRSRTNEEEWTRAVDAYRTFGQYYKDVQREAEEVLRLLQAQRGK